MDLGAALASGGLPPHLAASLATVDRNGRVDAAVSGIWPDGRHVMSADPFYAASLSKQVTGAAIALLVRDHLVDPDEPLGTDSADLPDWVGAVTVRQLLHHTAGLPAAGMVEPTIPGPWTSAASIAALRTVRPAASGVHVYSNLGYILLARLVAIRTGLSFADFVASRFGLNFPDDINAFPQTPLLGDRLPLSHGDGGLWVAAAAFAGWLHRQNRDEFGIESLVTAAGPGDYGWGIGRRTYRNHPLFIHGGSWQGAAAMSARSPTFGVGVVALVAGDEIDRLRVVIDAVLDGLTAERGK